MSSALNNNADFLKALLKVKPNQRKILLKTADNTVIRCICECAHNTLNGKVPLNKQQLNKLSRHKTVLRKLIKKGENYKTKRKLIVQTGGAFLPALIAPLIGGILGSLFKN